MFQNEDFDNNMFQFFIENAARAKNSKKKIYHRIKESEDLITRNFKLVYLGTNNLAHYQTNKLEQKIENIKKTYDNIKVHKLLKEHTIINLDILRSKIIFKKLQG